MILYAFFLKLYNFYDKFFLKVIIIFIPDIFPSLLLPAHWPRG